MIFWLTVWFHYWLPFLIACIYDMPNCLRYAQLLFLKLLVFIRYAQIVIILYKFMLSIGCYTRLITVRAFIHIKQFKRDWTVTLRVRVASIIYTVSKTDQSDSAHIAAQSTHRLLPFRNSRSQKETIFIWGPIFKVTYDAKCLYSYRLTTDKTDRNKALRSSNHVNFCAINENLLLEFYFPGVGFPFWSAIAHEFCAWGKAKVSVCSVHHDTGRLSIDGETSFVI